MACITFGFCIAAASSGSFMIFAIMSAGVTPSSCGVGGRVFWRKRRKGRKGEKCEFSFFIRLFSFFFSTSSPSLFSLSLSRQRAFSLSIYPSIYPLLLTASFAVMSPAFPIPPAKALGSKLPA